jgi:hypothetical protein
VLGPGRHEIRHDALVSVSSLPDRHDLVDARPAAPQDPAAALMLSSGAGAGMPIKDGTAEEAGDAEVCQRALFGALRARGRKT